MSTPTVTANQGTELDMQIYPGYSDRSFVVIGEATRDYTAALKDAGGRFNPKLADIRPNAPENAKVAGWVFSNNALREVEALFADIANGTVLATPRATYAPRGGRGRGYSSRPAPRLAPQSSPLTASPPLRTTVPPTQRGPVRLTTVQYQDLRYTVIKPTVGMKASISMNGGVINTTVTMANPSPSGFVDIVYVKPAESENPDDLYKLAVVAGVWQVIGVVEDHTVTFSM